MSLFEANGNRRLTKCTHRDGYIHRRHHGPFSEADKRQAVIELCTREGSAAAVAEKAPPLYHMADSRSQGAEMHVIRCLLLTSAAFSDMTDIGVRSTTIPDTPRYRATAPMRAQSVR